MTASNASSPRRPRATTWALHALLCGVATAAYAAPPDPCAGTPQCRNLGPFTATALRVNVTRKDAPTAYQGVKTTVRFTNVSDKPLILGYRDKSSTISDDQGLAYRWSAKSYGIGVVGRDQADPQFQLAPGESREASFENILQYSMRREVAGKVFTHDMMVVELAVLNGRQVRTVREHAVAFQGLSASAGFGTQGGGDASGSTATMAGGTAAPQGANADPVQTASKLVDIFNKLKK